MALEQSFIVDLSKNNTQTGNGEQRFFCQCGGKQKIKAKIRRVLVKTTEDNYEDKCEFEKIPCKSCGQIFDLTKNIATLRPGKTVLVNVSYEKETISLKNNTYKVLYRIRKNYIYDEPKDAVEEIIVRDSLVYDKKSNIVRFFSPNKDLNLSYDNTFFSPGSIQHQFGLSYLGKTSYFEFDFDKQDFLKNVFTFSSLVKYENIQICFDYFMEIISFSWDKEFLLSQSFFQDFALSSKIFTEKRDGLDYEFTLAPNPFGGNGTIKRKLDVGDYLFKLKKMGHLTFIFMLFPPISTLAKVKALEFIYQSYSNGFLAPIKKLILNRATKPQKIIDLCCRVFYDNSQKALLSEKQPEFKFSLNTIKLLKTHEDALVIYKFFSKSVFLDKNEIENLFIKYNFEDVIVFMSAVITTPNLRNIKLGNKHFHHILKNNIINRESTDWLNIYYDTLNTLKLIMKIIEENKGDKINKKKARQLSRFSESKIFETKSFLKLKDLHDEMFAVYRALEDEEKDIIYKSCVKKYKNLNQEHDFFKFTVIPNLKELSQEGLVMKHCIYTYLNDIVKGGYLAISVKDTISKEMATLGIRVTNDKLYLQQLKGYENSRATKILIESVLQYSEKNGIIIKSENIHSSDFQPNEALEKRMKNYRDKAKSLIIRGKGL